jgi:hypothetical protein
MQQPRQHRVLRLNRAELSRSDPYDYGRDILRNFTHPNETALVAAFLACNMRYTILFALSMLHYERWQEMQRSVLPEYQPESDWRGMRVGQRDKTAFPAKHCL